MAEGQDGFFVVDEARLFCGGLMFIHVEKTGILAVDLIDDKGLATRAEAMISFAVQSPAPNHRHRPGLVRVHTPPRNAREREPESRMQIPQCSHTAKASPGRIMRRPSLPGKISHDKVGRRAPVQHLSTVSRALPRIDQLTIA
ncbi:hypothetical protein TOPH_02101 [Tolypocladium ophioglossoides CBS 100239]|uniref:Uncharacterized protein n=1 Tax=Tolypocladium ophioglossoides (strain CBS 100239) TaxID=1163406 RepID=A0A0L0NGV0_TOLOC|nr:hypothetical protein TOPH_02101 [Tolypocladium ophioglossoides CBS 100239]